MEIIKPVEHGALDLLPLEHGIGKPREPVGVDTPRMNNGWTYLGSSKRLSRC